MNRLSKLILFAALLAPVGCMKTVNPTTPPTAAQAYNNAAIAMEDFATDLHQVQQIEINLHKGGAVPDHVHAQVQTAIDQIAGYGLQIDALIAGNAGAVTIQAKVSQAVAALAQITISTGKLDPNATAALSASVTALQLLLNGLTAKIAH